MKAEDFFTVVLYSHVMADAIQLIAQNSLLTYIDVAKSLVSKYISLSIFTPNNSTDKGNDYGYALDVVNGMCCGFHDAIREGGGECIIRY